MGSDQTGLPTGPGRVPGRHYRVGLRLTGRPRPGHRPAASGRSPAPRPAQAGSQAGTVGWAAGRLAGPGRVAGRRVRPVCCLLPLPAPRPAQAGLQAGLVAVSPLYLFPTAPFGAPILKGFFPKINLTFGQLIELFFPSIVDLLKLGFLSISPIVVATF